MKIGPKPTPLEIETLKRLHAGEITSRAGVGRAANLALTRLGFRQFVRVAAGGVLLKVTDAGAAFLRYLESGTPQTGERRLRKQQVDLLRTILHLTDLAMAGCTLKERLMDYAGMTRGQVGGQVRTLKRGGWLEETKRGDTTLKLTAKAVDYVGAMGGA